MQPTVLRLFRLLQRGGSDFLASLCLLVLTCWVAKQALRMGIGGLHSPGPGFLVFFASSMLGILALHLLVKSAQRSGKAVQVERGTKHHTRVVWVVLSLAGYTLFVSSVGYLLVTFALLFFLFAMLQKGKKRWLSAAATAAAVSVVTYLVFSVWFKLSLPAGWIVW
jgi:putative tricarboxylic transport membrane protein